MFLNHYRLREQPFGVTPDPRYLLLTSTYREVLASLVYEIQNNLGCSALIAEPGLGKTTLLYHLLGEFRHSARTAFLFQTQCSSRNLLRYLLHELDLDSSETDMVLLHEQFKELVVSQARVGRRVLVFIDEAQNLHESVLETVRLLSNVESPESKLLHIILAGQPLLAEKLYSSGQRQFLQRFSTINKLLPFTREETSLYIDHRLRVAGHSDGQLFTAEAREMIAAEAGGIPRKINNLCFRALSLGCTLQKRTIDVAIVREVLTDLHVSGFAAPTQVNRAGGDTGGRGSAAESPFSNPRHEPQPRPLDRASSPLKEPCGLHGQRDESELSLNEVQGGEYSMDLGSSENIDFGMSVVGTGMDKAPTAKPKAVEANRTPCEPASPIAASNESFPVYFELDVTSLFS